MAPRNNHWTKKLKTCDFCGYSKVIFRNTPDGQQCFDCYRKDVALSDGYKNRNNRNNKNITSTNNQSSKKNKKRMAIEVADKKFSLYIRYLHSFHEGFQKETRCKCYTCDTVLRIAGIQCGHFIPRDNMYTRWLPENCRPQCKRCNEELGGNEKVFEERLNAESPGLADQLRILGRQVWSPSIADIQEVSDKIGLELRAFLAAQRNEILRK